MERILRLTGVSGKPRKNLDPKWPREARHYYFGIVWFLARRIPLYLSTVASEEYSAAWFSLACEITSYRREPTIQHKPHPEKYRIF